MLQDTPINDSQVESKLREYVQAVDNLSDREDQKIPRMQTRFARVRLFLDYLRQEEANEEKQFELQQSGGIWAEPFVPRIREQIEREIAWIMRRLERESEA